MPGYGVIHYTERVRMFHGKVNRHHTAGFSNIRGIGINIVFDPQSLLAVLCKVPANCYEYHSDRSTIVCVCELLTRRPYIVHQGVFTFF